MSARKIKYIYKHDTLMRCACVCLSVRARMCAVGREDTFVLVDLIFAYIRVHMFVSLVVHSFNRLFRNNRV